MTTDRLPRPGADDPRSPQGRLSDVKRALAARLLAGRGPAETIRPLPADARPQPSFAQERLWFVEQLTPGTAVNNVAGAVLLTGSLDAAALRRALTAVVGRHAPLRSRFAAPDGALRVDVGDDAEVLWTFRDLEASRGADAERDAARDMERLSRIPFDLTAGPLMRACLYRLGGERHLFGIVIHHIACDGWSLRVLVGDLVAFYAAEAAGGPAPRPLALSYYDHAAWQRQRFDAAGAGDALTYWRRRFATLPPAPYPWRDSATDSDAAGAAGAREAASLPREIAEGAAAFARSHGCTPFMVLLAAFKVLLHRVGRQTDICVGTPVANRDRREIEGHIGFFVNMLALRTDLRGDPSFRTALERVRATAVEGFTHQDLPFEVLMRHLEPEWQAGWRRLIQVAFAHHGSDPSGDEVAAAGLRVQRRDVHNGAAPFDLMLSASEGPEGLRLTLDFATAFMRPATARMLLDAFGALLAGALEMPDVPVSVLALQDGAAEAREAARGRRRVTFPSDRTLHGAFGAVAARFPERPAVTGGGETLSYGELDRRADGLARRLVARGAGPGARVALCLERSAEMIVALLAVLKAGAAYVPLDPAHPAQRLRLLTDIAAPAAVVTRRGLLPEAADHLYVDEGSPDAPAHALPTAFPDQAAYVIFTSGSTGTPKGVAVTHASAVRLFDATRGWLRATAEDVWSLSHSVAFDFSVWEIWGALLHGGRLVVVPESVTRDPVAFRDLLARERISVVSQTPSAFQGLMRAVLDDPAGLDRLRLVVFGGEALSFARLRPWAALFGAGGPALVNMYGITETTVHVTHRVITPDDIAGTSGSLIGRPLDDLDLFVADEHGRAVRPGVPGEILVGGAGLARGYLGRPALTAARFVASPLAAEGERLYRTGDLARRLPDGCLEYLGRIDDQLKNRGFRIEPGEIEAALRGHPAVADCVVCGRPAPDGGQRLVAYVAAPLPEADEGARAATVEHYRAVFDDVYAARGGGADRDPFDTAGWIHSASGLPIAAAEMRDWADETVNRVLALSPRSVLEIGCGLGLLALALAERCARYHGTDISRPALAHVAALAAGRGLANATFSCQAADDFAAPAPAEADVVVLNSVVQYFPDAGYLRRVLDGALALVGAEGAVFVGDVPSLPLAAAFHTAVARHRAEMADPGPDAARRVRQAVADERELRLDPAWFEDLVPGGHADLRLKSGRHANEMTRFRYDVTLHPASLASLRPDRSLTWSELTGGLDALASLLETGRPALVELLCVPNRRVLGDHMIAGWLAREPDAEFASLAGRAAELERTFGAVDPDAVQGLAERFGYAARAAPSAAGGAACFDVLLSASALDARRPWRRRRLAGDAPLAGDPSRVQRERALAAELREHLGARLPAHMVPDLLTILPAMPLTPNGKLDRAALPAPGLRSPAAGRRCAPTTDLERRLAALWRALLGVEDVASDDVFWHIGGHSLLAARLMFQIEAEFGVRVPLMSLFADSSLGGMAATIARVEARSDGPSGTREFWQGEARLPEDIAPAGPRAARRHLLLTGATGFLGGHLLSEALTGGRFEVVHCLVRAESDARALEKLRHRLQERGLWQDGFAARLRAVAGDLGAPRLGLAGGRFEALAEQVGSIVHNGCRVNFLEPYGRLRDPNVLGTREILRLACTGPAKPVHYVSSLGVFDDGDMDERFGLREDRLPAHPHTLDDAYSQSKWVGEEMTRAAGARGLPVTISRPSRIGGHSATGDGRSDDLLWLILGASMAVGALPRLDLPLDVVPVDYAARAVLAIHGAAGADGRAFHLNNPRPARFADVAGWLAEAGHPLDELPYAAWRERIAATARRAAGSPGSAAASRLLPLLAAAAPDSTAAARRAWADCSNTLRLLEGRIDPCPPVDGPAMARRLAVPAASGAGWRGGPP